MILPDDPQWNAMWQALADATGDPADECPETGECWQYMGTYDGAHQFRHRNRPATAQWIKGYGQHCGRVYLNLDAQTLEIVRLTSRTYQTVQGFARGQEHPSELTSRSEPTCDYGGAFDGFTVTSDADPGL